MTWASAINGNTDSVADAFHFASAIRELLFICTDQIGCTSVAASLLSEDESLTRVTQEELPLYEKFMRVAMVSLPSTRLYRGYLRAKKDLAQNVTFELFAKKLMLDGDELTNCGKKWSSYCLAQMDYTHIKGILQANVLVDLDQSDKWIPMLQRRFHLRDIIFKPLKSNSKTNPSLNQKINEYFLEDFSTFTMLKEKAIIVL